MVGEVERMRGSAVTKKGRFNFRALIGKSAGAAKLIAVLDLVQVIVRDLDDRIIHWSAAAERLYGWSRDQALGQISHDLLSTEFPKPLSEIESELRDAGHWDGELVHRTKDGRAVNIASHWVLQRDAAGQPVAVIEVNYDITDRKRADAERKRAETALRSLNENLEQQVEARLHEREIVEDQLRQSQKMEAVGQLTGGIAHDFNNLLTVISGNLEVLDKLVGAENPRAHKLINMARQGTERAARLTAQLLAFSRQQRLRPEVVCLNRLLDDIRNLIERAVGDRVEVRLDCDPGLRLCRVDPSQFQSAILNLAVNARDAITEGGEFRIETRNMEIGDDPTNRPPEIRPGPYLCVSVCDNGGGIAPDVIGRIFEPFFTTKDIGKGTGLGLSQVYGFVRQSEGSITVESEVGRGTTFRIYLPKAADPDALPAIHPGEPASDEMPASHEPPKGSETILVVEDDAGILDLLLTSLSDLGYRVLSAQDATEAFDILRGPQGEHIDLLLTDILMPRGLSGVGLARTARDLRPGIKVMLMSGYASGGRLASEGGADLPLLSKPFRQADLARKLRAVLDEAVPVQAV